MPSRSGLLLAFIVLAALAAVGALLFGEDLGMGGGEITRADGAEDEADLIDLGNTRLVGPPGARRPEDIEAEQRAREETPGPGFPRTEGVFGRVTDASGGPVADATVKLMVPPDVYRRWGTPDPPPIATAPTNANGEFLVGPAPPGRLRLRVEAPSYAPSVKNVNRRGYRVDVILDRGGSLQVSVRNTAGDALPGARVLHQAGGVVTDGITDEEGCFTFPGLPTGAGALFVTAEGYAGAWQNDVAVSPGEVKRHTVVLGKPLIVEGRVLEADTERPVEGARCTLRYPTMPWLEATGPVAADERGAFEVGIPLPVGQHMDVEVTAEGFAPSRAWYQATDAGDGRMTLEIKLARGGEGIRGHVVDHRSRTVGGVLVTYAVERSGQGAPETKTASDGSFFLPPTAWATRRGSRIQIVALSETGGVGSTFALLPKEGESPEPVKITLTGVGAVQGRVTDPAGEGVAGALVSLTLDWSATMQHARTSGRRRSWTTSSLLTNPRYVLLDEVTDDLGHFTIDSVPVAVYQLSTAYGLDRVTLEETVVVETGTTVHRDVTLGEGATIEGRVLNGDGQPVPGAYVSARPEGRRGAQRSRSNVGARSRSDGGFVLHGISADRYTIRASAAGFQSGSEQGISPGTTDVNLVLVPLGWIEGIVRFEGREYQGTFVVSARRVGGRGRMPNPQGHFSSRGRSNTFNTDDGRFVLRNLRGGEYDVSAQTPDGLIAPGAQRVQVTDGVGSSVDLSLVGGAVVTGILVNDRTGAAIQGARINIRALPGPDAPVSSASVRTDAQGRFTARGLSTGSYVVHVWPPSSIAFQEPIDLQAGEHRNLRLRERAPGMVRVFVRDSDGRPVEGATARIKNPSGTEVWPNWAALRREGVELGRGGWNALIRTDASGVNLRRHVPPGHYDVTAIKEGFAAGEPRPIDVASDRITEVEIVLGPAAPTAPPRPPGIR